MSFSDLLLKQVTDQLTKQIDQDIMNTMFNGAVVSNKVQTKSSALTEQLMSFAYDETIDNFVYAFMNNDSFSKMEKDVLYDFGQMISEQLNIHRLCTFLPLDHKSKLPIMEKYSFKDEWYKNYAKQNASIINYECSMDMLTLLQSNVAKNRLIEVWVRNVVNELHFQFLRYLKKEATFLDNIEIDPMGDITSLDFFSGPKRFSTLQNFHRKLNTVIQTKKIDNPWIIGTSFNFNFMKDYFQNDFMVSPLQEMTKSSGLCIEGSYSPTIRKYSPFNYISHHGIIEDKQEDIIIGNDNSITNESLVAGLELVPRASTGGNLYIKIKLLLIKNPDFSNNYLKMHLNYKNM